MIKIISKLFSKPTQRVKSIEKKADATAKETTKPKYEEVQDCLAQGNDALAKGNLSQAELHYKKALSVAPDNINAHMNLGWVYKEKKSFMIAQEFLLKVTRLNPQYFEAYYVLGGIYDEHQKYHEAIAQYQKVIEINPDFQFVYADMAKSYFEIKEYEKAQTIIKQGIQKYPDAVDFHFQLGVFYIATKQYSLAHKSYEKVMELGDTSIPLYTNMAKNYLMWGQPEKAIEYYEKLLRSELLPTLKLQYLTSLLFNSDYLPGTTLEKTYELAKTIKNYYPAIKPYDKFTRRNPEKLRVGFVSGDLRTHPVAYFLESVLMNMDKSKFELIAYSTEPLEDKTTQKLKSYFNEWNCIGSDDATKKIYSDQIDILIDLSGHTLNNGLINFIAHPSPVQVTWLGYWGTTGLQSMDYILADETSITASETQYYVEKVKYLPETRLCFSPPQFESTPETSIKDYITFGCYQNVAKINQEVTHLWKKVLDGVPGSKIKLQVQNSQDIKDLLVQKLTLSGISPNQYIIADFMPRSDYLKSYNDIDIILDTFPYTGGTTTCEALYMGVPTITLKGDNVIARQGASMMNALGLEDWVAHTQEEYVNIAVEKCEDMESLNLLKQFLRERFSASLLGNTKAFTRNFQQALIEMYEEKTSNKAFNNKHLACD